MPVSIIKQPNPIVSNRNPVGLYIQCDVNFQSYNSYYINVEVVYEKVHRSNTFYNLYTFNDISPRPTDGVVEINLSSVLQTVSPVDNSDFTTFSRINEAGNTRYRVYVEEYVNGVVKDYLTVPNAFSFRAGYDFILGQHMQKWIEQGIFLTHQFRQKRTSQNLPEFLSYCIPPDVTHITMQVEVTLADGTTGASTPISGLAVNEYDVHTFKVGYKGLSLIASDNPTNPIISWTVQLKDQNLVFCSEKFTYNRICEIFENNQPFFFENTLGGWDSILITGVVEKSVNVSKQVAEKVPPVFYDAIQDQPIEIYNVTNQKEYKAFAGYKTLDEMFIVTGLLKAKYAYLVLTDNIVPVQITSTKEVLKKTKDFIGGFEFTFKEAFNNVG